MADFTPEINGPQSAWIIGRGAEAPTTTIGGVIGQALTDVGSAAKSGLASYITGKQNSLEGSEGQDLSDAVREYANGPKLVGQETSPMDTDPTLQAGKAEIDRHVSAAAQGTPGAKQALLTRVSEITSRYASQNPYYAPDLQKYAQTVLGFNPNAALFDEASHVEDFKRGLVEGAQKTMYDAAVSHGALSYVDGDPSKGPDIEATTQLGRGILQSEADTTAQMKLLEMQKQRQGTPLTQDELVNQQFGTVRPHLDQILNSSAPGLLTGIQKTLQRLGPDATDKQRAQVFQAIGISEAQATLNAHTYLRQFNASPQTLEKVDTYIKSQFSAYHTLATGDLSTSGLLQKQLQSVVDRDKLRFNEVAPAAAAIVNAVGPQAASGIFGNVAQMNSAASVQTDSYVNGSAKPVDVMHKTADAANGQYDPTKEQNPKVAAQVNKNLVTNLESYAKRPDKLSDKEQASFGNSVVAVGRTALNMTDRQQIQYGAHALNSPGFLTTFDHYAKNPMNADQVPVVAAYVRDTNMNNVQKAGQFIRQGVDISIPVTTGSDPTGPFASRMPQNIGIIQVHASAAYNPAAGGVEFQASATQNGKRVTLTAEQVRSVQTQTSDFRSSINEYNRSLSAVAHMSKYPGGMMGTDQSEKEFHVQNSGVPFKAGTHPGAFQTEHSGIEHNPDDGERHLSRGDINAQNHNPGNLRTPDGKGWQKFSTEQEGITAVGHQIGLYMKRGLNTIKDIVHKYAPPSENNTNHYIAYVAGRLGKLPTELLTADDIPDIRDAMIEFEQGGHRMMAGR